MDAELLAFIDTHATNRSQALEEAVRLWRQERIQAENAKAYAAIAAEPEQRADDAYWGKVGGSSLAED